MKPREIFWFLYIFMCIAMDNNFKEKDTMGLFLQRQPYNLTMAKHTLGLHQMRVMARIVEVLQPHMSMKVDYTTTAKDIWVEVRVGELVKSNNIKPLREALDGLMKKIVRIMHYLPEKATYLEIGTPIIQEYKHEHGDSMVKLKISGNLLPQIIDLARGYTKYSVQIAFATSSPNVFKIYQYIAHFRDVKQIQCNIDTLRKWLQLEGKYSEPAAIKRWVLDPAMKELKEKADVWFDIKERVTKGRKLLGWKFNIYAKKETKKHMPVPDTLGRSDIETGLGKILVEKYKLSPRQATKLLQKVGDDTAIHKELYPIYLLISDRKITSIGGYTAKVLGEKFNIKL